jgi:hypothetical protein
MAKASALLGQTGSGVGSLGNAELFFHAETQVENYLQVAKFARVCPDAPLFIPDRFLDRILHWVSSSSLGAMPITRKIMAGVEG